MAAFWLSLLGALLGNPVMATDPALGTLSSDWLQVREQTTCEAMQDEYCVGRYGFTIYRGGTFLAGPSAKGEKAEGRITAVEMQQLEALLRPIAPDAPGSQTPCKAGGLPGIKDQVDVTFKGATIVRIYDLGGKVGQVCFRGSPLDVERLHQYLHKLMTRYYTVPFPKH